MLNLYRTGIIVMWQMHKLVNTATIFSRFCLKKKSVLKVFISVELIYPVIKNNLEKVFVYICTTSRNHAQRKARNYNDFDSTYSPLVH